MFKLNETTFKLISLNTRTEIHGDDHKGAEDLAFKASMPNSVLDMFDDELKTFLFKKRPTTEQDLAEQGTDEDYLPDLRLPYLQDTQAWKWEGAGYRLVIDQGIDEKSNLYFIDVKLSKFKFSPKEGGSVEVQFMATVHPTNEEAGKLFGLQQEELTITLEPPSAETRAQMELDQNRGEAA